MSRITMHDLVGLRDSLSRIAGTPAEPYTRNDDGTFTPNAYNYHLSGAYGGWSLHQFGGEGTGTRDVLRSGHVPKRELYRLMAAYCDGMLEVMRNTPTTPTED